MIVWAPVIMTCTLVASARHRGGFTRAVRARPSLFSPGATANPPTGGVSLRSASIQREVTRDPPYGRTTAAVAFLGESSAKATRASPRCDLRLGGPVVLLRDSRLRPAPGGDSRSIRVRDLCGMREKPAVEQEEKMLICRYFYGRDGTRTRD